MKKFLNYPGKVRRLFKDFFVLLFVVGPAGLFRYLWAILTALPEVLREKSLHPAFKKLSGRIFTFKGFGTSIKMDGKFFGYTTELFARKVYFTLPEFRIHKGDTVVDLGAAEGSFSVLAATLGARVMAVEADSKTAEEGVKRSAELNGCSANVDVVEGIVGGGTGMFSGVGPDGAKRYSLADLLKVRNISRVDFMKVDIEGSEYDLFADDPDWLSGVQKIAMEIHFTFGQSFEDAKKLRANLERHGFKVWFVDINGHVAETLGGPAAYLFALRKNDRI